MAGDDPYTIGEGKAAGETPKALRFEPEEGEPFWVPKSVIHDDSEVWEGDQKGTLVVKLWWAEANGHA